MSTERNLKREQQGFLTNVDYYQLRVRSKRPRFLFDPSLDGNYLNNLYSCNLKCVYEMFGIFISMVPSEISRMESYVDTQNWEGIAFTAHRLKSNFALVGATNTDSLFRSLEQMARNKEDMSKIKTSIEQVVQLRDKVISVLTKEMRRIERFRD